MNNTFIYGLPTSIDNAPMMGEKELDAAVGGNTGNLAFCYALSRHLGGNIPTKSWLEQASGFFNEKYTGVLTLANQLGSHADLGYFSDALEKHTAKLVGIGLGAQTSIGGSVDIPEGTQRWLKTLMNRAPGDGPNIGLRGAFTLSALEKYGLAERATVLGCPTLFLSENPNLGAQIKKNAKKKFNRIAVTAGHYKWKHLSKLEASLANLLTHNHDYIIQSPMPMITFGRGNDIDINESEIIEIRDYCKPQMELKDFNDWRIDHAVSFFSAPAWMEHLRRFDFVLGVRIHGVMLALQMGIPAICIVHDSRTKELCETMMVPHIEAKNLHEGIDREQLHEIFEFDENQFDENRHMLAKKYVDFLNGNKIPFVSYLNKLAGY
ncbi:polysaccharide pyruvyl transferase family protein [Escherichia coli]|nr:polysaccharide pyruvyl transferase family protein [Escherichia coli]